MKKLMILLSIFILASCQKEEVPDANYFACTKTGESFSYYKIDTNKKSIEMLGIGAVFDSNWGENGVYVTAHDSDLSMRIAFHKFSGELDAYTRNEDEEFGWERIADSSKCKSIEPLLN